MSDTGWISPGTVVSDDTVGTVAWSDPENAKASDDSYSRTGEQYSIVTTNYLKATNFGLSIPSESTIDGIEVSIERQAKSDSGANVIKDNRVSLVDSDGSILSANKKDSNYWLYLSDETVTYGGDEDLWSETWSSSDINDSDFGVVLSADLTYGTEDDARVDHIQIKVYYTEGGTPTVGAGYPLPPFKNS